MSGNSIRLSRDFSARRLPVKRLLSVLILILSMLSSVNGGHCLDAPPITSNEDFFILGRVPQYQSEWTLDITGEVENPLSLTLDELRALPQSTMEATLECDYSSGPWLLVSSAVWTGVNLTDLIELAVPKSSATTITFRALDGYRRGPLPLDYVKQMTGAQVAYEMNGEPLPEIQGWPARLALPGHVGNNWVRWLDSIEISSAPAVDAFKQWPIHARIMEPTHNEIIDECPRIIKGMVNAGEGREIVTVQISIDDGVTWDDAEMLSYFKPNIWKHWQFAWTPEKIGRTTIFARVLDEDGNIQNEDNPYGWRGYKQVVTVFPEDRCEEPQRADFNNDWFIDFADFSHLAGQWLMTGGDLPADIAPGQGDEQVGIPDLILLAEHWLDCFVPVVIEPSPVDNEEIDNLAPVLMWMPLDGITGYDIYLGTDACAVAEADYESQEYAGFVSETAFVPDQILEPNTVYYWRVDQVGHRCTSTGEVWSFTTPDDTALSSQ